MNTRWSTSPPPPPKVGAVGWVIAAMGAAVAAFILIGVGIQTKRRLARPTPSDGGIITIAPIAFDDEPAAPKAAARTAESIPGTPTQADAGTTRTSAATGVGTPNIPGTPAGRKTYNVIFITVDTLRHDLGFTGYPRPITKNLDALAAKATVYDHFYATASYTPKSFGAILSGRYTSEAPRTYDHYTTFHPVNLMFAERARDSVHARTFGVMCHHYFGWKTGMDQGFDLWDTSATPPAMKDDDPRITGGRVSDVAIGLLKKPENVTPPGGRRFLAWFHYFDPHTPYVKHDGAPTMTSDPSIPKERAVYDEEVWYTDQQLGRVFDYVASQPWASETAIIVTADHGEAFGERGHWRHGREVWEPLIRVPFVLYVPGLAPRKIPARRSHIDVAPTILELLGAPIDGKPALRGSPLLADVYAAPDAPLAEHDVFVDMPEGPFNEQRRAIVTGPAPGMKLIQRAPKRFELYDLAADPGEMRDLGGKDDRFAAVQARFDAIKNALEEVPAK